MRIIRTCLVLTAALAATGCSVENGGARPVTGPSEFGLSVTLIATPDQLPRDGRSQSVIIVTVRDESGRPVEGRRLAIGSTVGTVTQNEVVTDGSGQASFAFVAPGPSTVGNVATVQVTPIGGDFANAAVRTVNISLTGISNRTAPTPAFVATPASTAAQIHQPVTFDASTTTDEGARCNDACAYTWNFGDGTSGTGRIVTHTYTSARTYAVTLTVTDAAGASASTIQSFTVANVAPPTVSITVTPNPPIEDHPATFLATVTAGTGHNIVRYAWTFGDGTTGSVGPSITKTFEREGTFVVNVTVTDDIGQTASASLRVIVGDVADSPGTTGAWFVWSPTDPAANELVRFDASASRAPAGLTIVEYEWVFGDGGTGESDEPRINHTFTTARTYLVRLTIHYSNGGSGTVVREVEIE